MSRIGRQPISIPAGVTIEQQAQNIVVTGPKGTLQVHLLDGLAVEQADNVMTVKRLREDAETQKSFGLMRTLIDNLVIGVSTGFTRQLEINGVGYRASVAGQTMTLALGFSHPVIVNLPEGISATVDKNLVTIAGHDKQLVGQVAANIRALKKPEPYKGKGIKYVEERIRRKAGKTAAKS